MKNRLSQLYNHICFCHTLYTAKLFIVCIAGGKLYHFKM